VALAEELADCAWQHTAGELRAWGEEAAIRGAILADARTVVRQLSDLDRAAAFRRVLYVPGAEAVDYLPHCVHLPGGGEAVVGLRFLAGRTDSAFVQLEGVTRPLGEALDSLIDLVGDLYARFAPFALRLETGDRGLFDAWVDRGASADLLTIAGRADTLVAVEPPPEHARVAVRRLERMAAFETYLGEYRGLHEERPWLRDHVEPEERERLDELAAGGGLFEVRVDGEPAGVIAVCDEPLTGLRGQRIVEQLLYTQWRGRGFGAAAQRRAIEALSIGRSDFVVHGSIHVANTPALEVARRVGRVPVMWSVLVPLAATAR